MLNHSLGFDSITLFYFLPPGGSISTVCGDNSQAEQCIKAPPAQRRIDITEI